MSTFTQTPYPTPQEIIRVLANAFNTKCSNKTIDDLHRRVDMDFRKLPTLVEDTIVYQIKAKISESLGSLIENAVNDLFSDYFYLVGTTSLAVLDRESAVKGLGRYFFAWKAAEMLRSVHLNFSLEPTILLSDTTTALDGTFKYLEQKVPWWNDYLCSCSKQQKDRFLLWRKGKELPSLGSITILSDDRMKFGTAQDWEIIKSWLVIARFVDALTATTANKLTKSSVLFYLNLNSFDYSRALMELQRPSLLSFEDYFSSVEDVRRLLSNVDDRSIELKNEIDQKLVVLETVLNTTDSMGGVAYYVSWFRARWYVYAGDLVAANECYKNAFDQAVFRAGKNVKHIIREALLVASGQDKKFLKRLKNVGAMFGWEFLPMSAPSQELKNRTDQFIEDWEIESLKQLFFQYFPASMMFIDSPNLAPKKIKAGPLVVNMTDKIKPDLRDRDLNKQINVGVSLRKKRMPQLVWFSVIEDVEAIRLLLDKGADVNVKGDCGETPILMALQAMDMTSHTSRSMNDTPFWLFAEQAHKKEILDQTTTKQKMSALMLAVMTGRPMVVRKLLDMGASVDLRANTSLETPLNACLKLISIFTKPDLHLSKRSCEDYDDPTLVLDGARRTLAGIIPNDMQGVREFLEQSEQQLPSADHSVKQLIVDNVHEHGNLDDLRAIARCLLEYGASPNKRHEYPLKGYTPLMLAAELDESELFDLMLECGGDLTLDYFSPGDERTFNAIEIAQLFNSAGILAVLQSRQLL